jgi:hypothetical protein
MTKRLGSLAVLLGVAVAMLSGCDFSDEGQVRSCYTKYANAIRAGDGAKAVEQLNSSTIDHYADLLDHALYSSEYDVRTLGIYEQLVVLTLRHRVSVDALRRMDGEELLRYCVYEGLIDEDSVGDTEIGEVTVDGDVAVGVLSLYQRASRLEYRFTRENGEWKLDLDSIVPAYEKILRRLALGADMDDDDLVLWLFERETGEVPSYDLWQPLDRG